MSEQQKAKKKSCIKDMLREIGDSIIGEVIINLLLFIPRIIGKLLKAIFS